jgi:outer membrane usher protein FimD/PapC
LSLTNSLGLTASGTIGGPSAYNFQNRTIIALGSARLRANLSVASHHGLLVDDLVGELDRKDLRYSAGVFWAPGNEFIGQRRIMGAGVGTQFDTSIDRETLQGSPLIVFLAQPARVELLLDGRLVSSRSYPAGNIDLDTLALPHGSYPVIIRIHQSNGSVREERRFFVRSAQIAPVGHPLYYAYAGVLANTQRNQPISPSSTLYYQAGTARRLTNNFALDGAVMGTQHKAIAQAGAWLIKGQVRVRAAALLSTAGDAGALVQASKAGGRRLNISFDLRRIRSRDGKPLVPLPSHANSFDASPSAGIQLTNGSYTQATAHVGYRLGRIYLSMTGSYRKDRHSPADYNIGPSLNLPIVNRSHLQLVFEATAQRTRTTTAGFAGIRALFTSERLSMLGRLGHGIQSERNVVGTSNARTVSSFSAQYTHETEAGTVINVEGGADRNVESSTIHAGGNLNSRFGALRGGVLHNLEGSGRTQYDLTFQSGMALGTHAASLGGRDVEQSAVIISIGGDAPKSLFKVLVDDVDRGQVKIGQRLSLFMPSYRTYRIRLVRAAPDTVSFDGAAREVTLYPGNVRYLAWRAESYFTVFAQAISNNGTPISKALVQTARGVAETDANGYFQIDMRRDDPIMIAIAEGPTCRIKLGNIVVKNDFASVGKVVCH